MNRKLRNLLILFTIKLILLAHIIQSSETSATEKALLFTPLTIRNVTLRNRISVSPMCMYSSDDGIANDFHLAHLLSFALGGAGLVMVEATGVTPEGRITPKDMGLWKDEQIEPLARIVRLLKHYGAVPGIQLGHAGRRASTTILWLGGNSIKDEDGGWQTISSSAKAYSEKNIWKVPKMASIEDIEQIKKAFVSAAERAVKAGFQVIELHFAHGYLVHQFLSPLTNSRSDKYGGSLENRMRLGLEIAQMVRKALPANAVLGVRVSVTDYHEKGWDVNQVIELAKQLKTIGVDFVDCSPVSGIDPESKSQGFDKTVTEIQSSKQIQKEANIMTSIVGRIIDPKYAEKLLKENSATLVMLARAMLNNPHWPYHAADVLNAQHLVQFPDQYGYVIGVESKWRSKLKEANH